MGRLSGKQVLMILGQKNYNEEEVNYLHDLFLQEGAVVSVCTPQPEKAVGRLEGYTVPHLTIAEADPTGYDGIVLIGGYGAYTDLWNDEATHRLLQEADQQKKLIAAASVAPVALANAGILQGRKATTFPDYNAAVILEQKGAIHVYEDVVTDDNIVTSNHPRKVKELGKIIVSKIAGE